MTIRQKQDGVVARNAGRYRDPGVLDVAIDPPVKRTRIDAEVCIRNTGRGTVVLSGILRRSATPSSTASTSTCR